MDRVNLAATVITALLLPLNILHSSGKMYNELFGYASNALWVFTVNTFLLVSALFCKVCHPCRRGHGWLTAFEFLQRKEAHHLGLISTGHRWVLGWFHCFLLLSLLCHLKIISIHLLITACFEVFHHHFKAFRQSPIEAVMLQFSYVIWREAFWE